jgi:hypothetical protein
LNNWEETGFSVFPNPAHETIHINFPGSFDLSVFSSAGEQVFLKKDCNQSANLLVKDLPVGIYYVLINAGEKEILGKVVVK